MLERMEGKTKYLVPSCLGMGLIEGYDKIEFEKSLSKPQLRREVIMILLMTHLLRLTDSKTERNMVQVCEGTKSKGVMLEEAIVQYKDIFMRVRNGFNNVLAVSFSCWIKTQPVDDLAELSKSAGTSCGREQSRWPRRWGKGR